MKNAFFAILMTCFFSSQAQVFNMNPNYKVLSGRDDFQFWHTMLSDVDTFTLGNMTLDLDKKVIRIPTGMSALTEMVHKIESFSFNKKLNRYDIRTKPEDGYGYKSHTWRLQLDPEGNALYFRDARQSRDDKNADTLFYTYVNLIDRVDWTAYSTRVYESGAWKSEYHQLDVQNNVLTWTVGEGKKAVKKRYPIIDSGVDLKQNFFKLATSEVNGEMLVITVKRRSKQDNYAYFIDFVDVKTMKSTRRIQL